MREILFRGKRLDNGEWIEGYYYCHDGLNEHYVLPVDKTPFYNGIRIVPASFDDYRVQPETLGQFTGKCDKNGKKIFEGDIHCNFDNAQKRNRYFIVRVGEFHDTVYDFDSYGCFFKEINGTNIESFEGNESDYVNIIGNIHDNPELL